MKAPGTPKTPGSGRKKGTPNKDAINLREKAKELGVDPFDVLLFFAKGDWAALGYPDEKRVVVSKMGINEVLYIQPEVRARAAAEACQYLYPKLKSIEHKGDEGKQNRPVLIFMPDNGRDKPST